MGITLHPGSQDWEHQYLQKGLNRINPASGWGYLYEPFWGTTQNWTQVIVGAEATIVTGVAGLKGGVAQMDSGTVTSSEAALQAIGNVYANFTTEKWYAAFRFKIPTTPDAQSVIQLGVADSAATKFAYIGVRGATSTTKFTLNAITARTQSAVTIDTSWHNAEIWGLGTTAVFASVDDEAAITATAAAANTLHLGYLSAKNGTTLATQTLQVDNALYIFNGN